MATTVLHQLFCCSEEQLSVALDNHNKLACSGGNNIVILVQWGDSNQKREVAMSTSNSCLSGL